MRLLERVYEKVKLEPTHEILEESLLQSTWWISTCKLPATASTPITTQIATLRVGYKAATLKGARPNSTRAPVIWNSFLLPAGHKNKYFQETHFSPIFFILMMACLSLSATSKRVWCTWAEQMTCRYSVTRQMSNVSLSCLGPIVKSSSARIEDGSAVRISRAQGPSHSV